MKKNFFRYYQLNNDNMRYTRYPICESKNQTVSQNFDVSN